MVRGTLLGMSAAVALCAVSANASTDVLSDSDLIARAADVMGSRQSPDDRVLGLYRDLRVIVDVQCNTGCPRNSVRIIRYEVPAGPPCDRIGEDSATITVPRGMTTGPQDFCIPHVLYKRKLYTDMPFQ